jgi:hypothetical protein
MAIFVIIPTGAEEESLGNLDSQPNIVAAFSIVCRQDPFQGIIESMYAIHEAEQVAVINQLRDKVEQQTRLNGQLSVQAFNLAISNDQLEWQVAEMKDKLAFTDFVNDELEQQITVNNNSVHVKDIEVEGLKQHLGIRETEDRDAHLTVRYPFLPLPIV